MGTLYRDAFAKLEARQEARLPVSAVPEACRHLLAGGRRDGADIRLRPPPASDPRGIRIARRLAAFLLLVALLPLFAGISLWVLFDDGFPLFFAQQRTGREGRPFALLKFRTMRGPSRPPSAASNPLDKRAADPRVTRGGAILRRFSLDELPQLVNILRGEMAFVGPRPLPTDESRVEEPWQAMRYRVLPGLTGLWQVTARNRSSFEELCRIDFLAVCARSPRLWMRIFLRTFPEILGGGGR